MRLNINLSKEDWTSLVSLLSVVKGEEYKRILDTIKTQSGRDRAKQKRFMEEYDRRVAGIY